MSMFYTQVKGLFDMIFMFVMLIVLVVVVMSVVNTMSMSVMERTREIGTMRAVGMQRSYIVRLFIIEGGLLAIIGGGIAVMLTYVLSTLINTSNITYTPPNGSEEVGLFLLILPINLIVTFLFMSFMVVLASRMPAKRAAKMPVVEALTHV